MNKLSKYLCIGALGLGLWSCSSEEPVNTEVPKFTGEQALVTINLYSPENATKAGADGGSNAYDNGSAEENTIDKVNFYFYDETGKKVAEYLGAQFTLTQDSDPLIGRVGTTKIVLTDLPGKSYPSYVIAIANPPAGMDATNLGTLQNAVNMTLGTATASVNPWGVGNDGTTKTNFIMTSATHDGNPAAYNYFATALSPENFAVMDKDAGHEQGGEWVDKDGNEIKSTPIEIYIERLASKVELTFASSKFTLKTEEKGSYYEMPLPDITMVTGYREDGSAITEVKKYNARIYGWGVNGIAKTERYFKQINSGNTPFVTSDGWDFSGTNRSYWAVTPNYNSLDYPANFGEVNNKTGVTNGDQDLYANSEILRYISWTTVKNNGFTSGGNFAYIRPHTVAGNLLNLAGNQLRHSAVTEVLLAAQIVDTDGTGVTLFQIGEDFYTSEGIINYMLNSAGKHFWTPTEKDAEDNVTKSRTIEANEVKIVYDYDGVFKFDFTDAAKALVWYQDKECVNAWGNSTTLATNSEASITEINTYLPLKQTYGYMEGLMYYNIPIRHLRPNYVAGQEIKTGMFGVVRNHWYKVNITDLKKLGHSVYRPDEHIIPPSDDTEFMIGASIKVVSWRLVRQDAEL